MTKSIPTGIPGLTLRFAAPGDGALILELIKGLAEYERLSHEVVADEDSIEQALFADRQVAEVVIADLNGDAAGFALFFFNFSTFLGRPGIYLEDLFVLPAMRGRGIGTALLTFLAKLARDRGCGRFEWSVLDWNEPALRFYEELGAKVMDEWKLHRVTGEALDRLADRFENL
jgi:GNAT superfamily N-acetyltransferase